MRSSARIVIAVVVLVLLAGCSSSATTTPTSTAGSSNGANRPAGSATAPTADAVSSAGSPAGGVAPAALDEGTLAWFSTLCTGLAKSIQSLGTSEAGLADATLPADAVLVAATAAGRAFGETATALAAAPPPTFEGGDGLAAVITASLGQAATDIPAGGAAIAALNPTDAAGVAAARSTFQGRLLAALAPLQAINQLPPDIQSAVKEIPECKALAT